MAWEDVEGTPMTLQELAELLARLGRERREDAEKYRLLCELENRRN